MIRNLVALLAVIGVAVILVPTFAGLAAPEALGDTARGYAESVPADLGAANLVTGIIVSYRGFDTLGEVSVLFLAATGVGFALKAGGGRRRAGSPATDASVDVPPHRGVSPHAERRRSPSEILETGSALLVPLLILFGAYIFVHGHLTPGGGFQGGVVIASALVLSVLGSSSPSVSSALLGGIESLSGAFYVAVGIAGLIWATGFLDTTFLPGGKLGTLLSAGAIPVIYTLVGLKVGTELTGIIERLRDHQEDQQP
jgi:multicomponent Na+:H+ antiporter subunit B